MDPVTHGLVGAAAAVWTSSSKKLKALMGAGALAAMAPDLDILIKRPSDPLFQLEFHRQFSHSLLFAPLGALLVSVALWWLFRRWLDKRELYLATLAGILTAGPLDACTSYGTQLLWPFSATRLAWNLTPVVEPFFTLFLLALFIASMISKQRIFQAVASVGVLVFLGHGAVQKSRAARAAESVRKERGHQATQVVVKPTLGNQILWRVTYIHEGRIYTDAVRTGFFSKPRAYTGDSLPLVELERDYPELQGTRTYYDFQRFSRLSQGYLIQHPDFPNVLGDGRYAMLPTSLKPLWGLRFDPEKADRAPAFVTFRDSSAEVRGKFLGMLMGREPGILP